MSKEKQNKGIYVEVLKSLFPHIKSEKELIIFSEVITALKVNGQLNETSLTKEDIELIHKIKESILSSPEKMNDAIAISKKLLAES